ncbi:uncharacterized protein PRCAT00001290001 [Priceomyces carsonii]|uniref:uncharacterized protein n=1 Tax=Priceomyces carsonii TaxID=28549 RepID=UPI002ED993A6|nr:unnamed protein product [Priceomyces carsonii]
MVLKNSKWDKKAKYKYLKKHGLLNQLAPQDTLVKQKWSSKRRNTSNRIGSFALQDSDQEIDSEWDSEDEALLTSFYPGFKEDELSLEQKKKLKNQILKELVEREVDENDETSLTNEADGAESVEGIYLGKEPKEQDLINNGKETQLGDYILKDNISKPRYRRKMLKNKMTDNFLEEYGIESYDKTLSKNFNYDDIHKKKLRQRALDLIPTNELIGFKVGESSLDDLILQLEKVEPRSMTPEEREVEKRRLQLANEQKLFSQIKKKFGSLEWKTNPKVLNLDTIDSNDEKQLANLNSRISRTVNKVPSKEDESDFDGDLSELLEGDNLSWKKLDTESNKQKAFDIDEMLSTLSMIQKDTSASLRVTPNPEDPTPASDDQGFLDDLLG